MKIKTFKDGLAAASTYLIGTAEDFEQSATRLKQNAKTPLDKEMVRSFKDRAILLRGQAAHILDLKEGQIKTSVQGPEMRVNPHATSASEGIFADFTQPDYTHLTRAVRGKGARRTSLLAELWQEENSLTHFIITNVANGSAVENLKACREKIEAIRTELNSVCLLKVSNEQCC